MRMLCRQFARSGETKESVSNDGDGNKNGKKAENLDLGLDWHNNNFARTSRYLYISLLSLQDYDVRPPIFTFY